MKCTNCNIQIFTENDKNKINKHYLLSSAGECCQDDNFSLTYKEENMDDCSVGSLRLKIERTDPWDMTGLIADAPIQMALELKEAPEVLTCMYLFSPWWTRPAFVTKPGDAPDQTQMVFLKFKDHVSCFMPMVGNVFKTTVCGGEDKNCLHLCIEAGVAGLRELDEIIYLYADGETVEEAVKKVFLCLKKRLRPADRPLLLREERQYPEFLKYLGWCSWDAFYKTIDEEKIRQKAQEFENKGVPVRWMLFDDGWMKDEDAMLCGFEPDKEKFPTGFDKLITDIKASGKVNWFGVWHAFGGYWAGVKPDTDLAEAEKDHLYLTRNGRLVPDPKHGAGFYQDWYQLLKAQQIDFVKVDGQGATPIYFKHDQPIAAAARGMNEQLEIGTEIMGKNVINCMGMPMENILARPETGISRNSDDFFPNREGGFAEHLLENAYNALYHNEIYHCDWDMFWTMHPDAEKHALLRAISGGPIYFSDRIGETNPDIVKRFCDEDGRLLLLKRSAKPTADCIFQDPTQSGILKIHNVGPYRKAQLGGVLAAFNLTDTVQTTTISYKEVPEMTHNTACWVYNYFNRKIELLASDEKLKLTLQAGEYAYFLLLPKEEEEPDFGDLEKYVSFMA